MVEGDVPTTREPQLNDGTDAGTFLIGLEEEVTKPTPAEQDDGTFMTGLDEEVTIISKAPTQIQSNGGPDAVTSIVIEQEAQPDRPREEDDGTFLFGLEEEVSKPTPAPQTSDGSDTFHFGVTFKNVLRNRNNICLHKLRWTASRLRCRHRHQPKHQRTRLKPAMVVIQSTS